MTANSQSPAPVPPAVPPPSPVPHPATHAQPTRPLAVLTQPAPNPVLDAALAAVVQASERRFRLLADNASDLIILRNLHGQMIYVSPSVERLCGYTPAEIMRMETLALVATPAEVEAARERRDRYIALAAQGLPLPTEHYERHYIHKNGSTVVLDMITSGLYDEHGKLEGTISVGRDILALKQTEETLRQANAQLEQRVAERTVELRGLVAQLERANAGKDAFMAAVSHELRTPLTGILGLAETLALQAGGPLTPRQLHYVETIQASGERLLAIVNSVLAYTYAMAEATPPPLEPCLVLDLCTRAVHNVRAKAERKGLAVAVAVEPPTLTITTDPDSVIKVLTALLDNAVKFTPSGGRLGVHARLDPGPGSDPGPGPGSVRVDVWDTGIGIPPEQLPHLFAPFTQGDQRLARQYEGIGLGLAYVQRRVATLGGAVSVESTPGQGSRFTVTLPGDFAPH